MRYKQFIFIFVFLTVNIVSYSQKISKADIKQKFVEGNSFFLFEEYIEALPYYLELHKLFPDNDNLNYRIGICYMNIPGEKEKAITYLEKAIANISLKYREKSIRETHAPIDAYFYLGNAYRVNNKLDKALEMYNYFKEHMDTKVYEEKVVDNEIQACLNAKKLEKEPMYISEKNLGKTINSRFSDYRPVISGDEKTFVFTRKLPFYDAVFYTHKENGKWSPTINLTPQLGIDQDFYSSSLSYDGKILYLYKNDQYDGNIYISKFLGDHWSKVIRLNNNINTKYWESHACVTRDEKTLYFTSNRKGGYGALDIYMSKRDSTGDWGPAINLGPIINTEYNEETPFISADGKTLFFSSYGHFNMGGYDIFYSNLLADGNWSVPLNMGYPINTTDDDFFYQPVGEGYYAYYSKFAQQGFGNMDIFKLEIFSAEHPRKFLIQGTVSLNKKVPVKINKSIYVNLLSKNLHDTLNTVNPDTSGVYRFVTNAGKYNLSFHGEGFKTYTRPLSLPMSLDKEKVYLPRTMMQLIDVTANLNVTNTSFNLAAGDTLNLKLNVEKGSWLTMQLYQDSVLIDSTRFFVAGDSLSFPILPPTGNSRIVLNLTDRFGNKTQKEIYLNIPVPVQPVVAEGKPVHQLRQPEIFPAQLQQMKDFLNILKHYATGSLLAVIQSIDPETMHFTDQFEIIDYLKKKATVSDYTPSDVDELLIIAAVRKSFELEDVYNELKAYATGSLKTFLESLDLSKSNIRTPSELFDYLSISSDSGYIDSTEIKNMVVTMATEKDTNLQKIYKHLSDLSQGQMKTAIMQANPEKNEIYSAWELTNYLFDKSDVLGYSPKELIYLFAQIATNGNPDVKEFLIKFTDKSSGSLHELLINIDLKANHIKSIKGLIDYLLEHAKQYHYTEKDILKVLMRSIISANINESRVRELINKNKLLTGERRGHALYWIIPLVVAGLIIGYALIRKRKK